MPTHYQQKMLARHKNMKAYSDIYEQYVDDASFLWILRSIVIDQPHYNKADIHELEERIDAQLDGLTLSADDAWKACVKALTLEEPGEVFTATIIAFKSNDALKIQRVLQVGLKTDITFKGLISALGWLPDNIVNLWIQKFLSSKDLNHKYLAIATCSVRRENPSEFLNKMLTRDDCKQHKKLYARSLRLVGELKRQDLIPYLNEAMSSTDDNVKFWACWSSIMLGNVGAVAYLENYIFKTCPQQIHAINIAFRVLPIDQARVIISKLSSDKEQIRIIIKATGMLGDPHAVNWLILKMRESALSRIAAEAFTMITGFDLDKNHLEREIPTHIYTHSNDSDDDDITLDQDENLPWPDHEQVMSFWQDKSKDFISGQRYFMGQPITAEILNNKLLFGNQRQRHAAALELALSNPALVLQNTKSRVFG